MKKTVAIIFLSCLFVSFTRAQSDESVYRFLSLAPSAHIATLGGVNVSLQNDDLNFTLQNPALITGEMSNMLSLSGVNYLAGINFGSVVYSNQFDDKNFWAAGVLFVDYGKFDGRDEHREPTGEFSASDVALHFVYGRKLSEKWTLGSTLKPIFSSYEQYSSFGLGVDVGVSYYEIENLFSAGFVLKNIGTQLSAYYSDGGRQHFEPFPFEIQAGVNKKLRHAPFRFSFTAHNLQRWNMSFAHNVRRNASDGFNQRSNHDLSFGENLMRHLIFGVEIVPSDKFYLGVGYNYRRSQELKILDVNSFGGFSFGGGLKLYKFNLGFAMSNYHPSSTSYHISISTNLRSFNF